jgi:transposase
MFSIGSATRVYVAAGATDMRKSFEGLFGLVRDRLQCDPLDFDILIWPTLIV